MVGWHHQLNGYLLLFSCSVASSSLRSHGARLLSPWNIPGNNTGVGCHFLLKGIFPTQGSKTGILHCGKTLNQLSYQGSLNGSPSCLKNTHGHLPEPPKRCKEMLTSHSTGHYSLGFGTLLPATESLQQLFRISPPSCPSHSPSAFIPHPSLHPFFFPLPGVAPGPLK